VDITGWTLYFTIKTDPCQVDADAIVQKVVTVHTNAASGLTEVELTHDDTTIAPRMYYADFKFVDDADFHRSPATAGMIYSDTDGHIYHYDGSNWDQLDN